MSENSLVRSLRLKDSERSRLGNLLGQIKSVGEFLAEAGEAFKDAQIIEAVQRSLPWVEAAGSALQETIPPVKFLATFFSKLAEVKDPEALARIAFTLAYQQSVEQALIALGAPKSRKQAVSKGVFADLRKQEPEEFEFHRFSFGDVLQHPFIHAADTRLSEWANAVGYGPDQQRELNNEVHQRFASNLKTILSHGETQEAFAPLTTWMTLGTGDAAAYEALAEHTEYQRWLFEEQPVFGQEPFALSNIYVDTDCGQLSWGSIRDGVPPGPDDPPAQRKRVDPFLERFGGRHPLSRTVLDLLGDSNLKDAIVIQGAAGAGKSAFTQWLCSELVRRGLRPIRILLRDLRLDRERPLSEALMEAIRLTDEKRHPDGLPYPRPEDLFVKGTIFRQRVRFGGAWICPYVLILDGWDEISVSVSEGFKLRVGRILERLRTEFLQSRDEPTRMRLILTGRPSDAVTDSTFLLKDTPVLTLRPLSPNQLEQLGSNLVESLRHPRWPTLGGGWPPFDLERLRPAFARYRTEIENIPSKRSELPDLLQNPVPLRGSLEVLGLPLLAFLAIRLLSEPHAEMEALLENPTTLYRNLVDLTCGKAGKYVGAPEEIDHQHRIAGHKLRSLLWKTAEAMTTVGGESTSFKELRLRLSQAGEDLGAVVRETTGDRLLSQLMISYYFKGGNPDLGCEFLHKSFREYLFAEGVVEVLKTYGRQHRESLPQRPDTEYWKDFDETDPRYRLIRELAPILAPQWLSPEIAGHLQELLRWEIIRSSNLRDSPTFSSSQPTEQLDLLGWKSIRDALADLWDWWSEGVHLRPQPRYNKRQQVELGTPYAHELAEWTMPLDYPQGAPLHASPRFTSIDSHLGDALFCLTCIVHFQVAREEGWLVLNLQEHLAPQELWAEVIVGSQNRRCQTIVQRGNKRFALFAPSGKSPQYFANYTARINSAGWRPLGPFPLGLDLSGIDLNRCSIKIPIPSRVPRTVIVWDYANLSQTDATGSLFFYHKMKHVFAFGASFNFSLLDGADLTGADLRNTLFSNAVVRNSNLLHANTKGSTILDRSREKFYKRRHSKSRDEQ